VDVPSKGMYSINLVFGEDRKSRIDYVYGTLLPNVDSLILCEVSKVEALYVIDSLYHNSIELD
jgi:hypothetical protein